MNHSDIAALMKGAAPAIRDFVASAMQPLVDRISELERELGAARSIDHAEAIQAAVELAVKALPPAPAGQDGRDGVDGKDGIDGKDGAAGVDGKDGAPGADGKDGQPGKDGADGAPGRDGTDGINGKDGAPGERGPAGPQGSLPEAKAWADGVHYAGEVRTHNGSLWQAAKDTGREPGHDDWICLATAGAAGRDADQIDICGTYDPGKTYRRLNIVALNGGAFIAKNDEPGECPGEGWQVIAMRGKPGQPGQSIKGDPGKGIKGDAGAAVVGLHVDGDGMLTLTNGDGTSVECDFYPLLSKVR